jgi:hypothetical protein
MGQNSLMFTSESNKAWDISSFQQTVNYTVNFEAFKPYRVIELKRGYKLSEAECHDVFVNNATDKAKAEYKRLEMLKSKQAAQYKIKEKEKQYNEKIAATPTKPNITELNRLKLKEMQKEEPDLNGMARLIYDVTKSIK